MSGFPPHLRILGLDPSTKGFGFAVLEARGRLVDWGVAELYSKKDEEFLVRVEALADKYGPAIIALEDCAGTRRGERARRRIALAADYAGSRRIEAVLVSRDDVRRMLGLSTRATKHEVATAITEAFFPELGFLLPRPRKLWQTEDERMRVFGAVAQTSITCQLSHLTRNHERLAEK